jgi:uncharacterized membrane protein YwaF
MMKILPADSMKKITRIFAVVFFVLLVGGYFLPDRVINAVADVSYAEHVTKIHAVLRWGMEFSAITLVIASFFNFRVLKNLSVFAVLPLSILEMIFIPDLASFYDAEWCVAYLSASIVIQFITAVLIMTDMLLKKEFRFNNWRDYLNFALVGLGLTAISMPVFFPQIYWGYTKIFIEVFKPLHFLYIGITLAEIAVLYYVFRFKDYRIRWAVVTAIALGLFISYNSLFLKQPFNLNRLPIQLCNLASYLAVICVIFRWKHLFNFMFLVNITGALVAIIGLDMSADLGLGYFWNIHFLVEHMQAFVLPALVMGFRLFPRMDKKSLLSAFVGYNVYFIFCLVTGGLVNIFNYEPGGSILNYFYLFNIDTAIEYAPFFGFLTRSATFTIRNFTFNIGLIFFIYFGFFVLVLLFYWVLQMFYKMTDDAFELRRSRINIWERLTGKKSRAPLEYPTDPVKLRKEHKTC